MNILNLGASFLVGALRGLGHQVVAAGLSADCEIRIEHPISLARLREHLAGIGFVPDCALWADNGNLPFLLDVEQMPCPSLLYSIDTFCNPWHIPFSHAFDLVLAAQKGYADLFPRSAPSRAAPAWLPLFAPAELAGRADALAGSGRDVPAAFVGTLRPRNIPQRIGFLERFRALHPLLIKEGAYLPVFARSCIVLNQTAAGEVNFRCFESMACGAALLTEASDQGLTDLFVPGTHILPTYRPGDAAQAAAIARDWLCRPADLIRVAEAGRDLVRARHTDRERAAHVAGLLEQAIAASIHVSRLCELDRRRKLLSTAYAILCAELTDSSVREHRALYHRIFEGLAGQEFLP